MATATTDSVSTPHLWEVDHDYYCANGNHYAQGLHIEYESWADFLAEDTHDDMDYNLLVRWDWAPPEGGDPGVLTCHWVGQRKALLRSTSCPVLADEEPLVRGWLQPRLDHLLKLWAPLVPTAAHDTTKD